MRRRFTDNNKKRTTSKKGLIMIDIKFLRENPDIVKENIKKKFQDRKI